MDEGVNKTSFLGVTYKIFLFAKNFKVKVSVSQTIMQNQCKI